MITTTCECPKCGGLPLDPRVVNVESDALFRVEVGAAVFSYPGERDVNWALERELNAPDNGLITLTCFDCDHRWTTEAPARRFDSDAAFNRATQLMNDERYDEARDEVNRFARWRELQLCPLLLREHIAPGQLVTRAVVFFPIRSYRLPRSPRR